MWKNFVINTDVCTIHNIGRVCKFFLIGDVRVPGQTDTCSPLRYLNSEKEIDKAQNELDNLKIMLFGTSKGFDKDKIINKFNQ